MSCKACGKEVTTDLCVDCFAAAVRRARFQGPAAEDDLSGQQTIRDWSKKLLTEYVQHFVGEKGWEKAGATAPEHLVDCIFSHIQVTLLGYSTSVEEANSKTEQIDKMLRVRK